MFYEPYVVVFQVGICRCRKTIFLLYSFYTIYYLFIEYILNFSTIHVSLFPCRPIPPKHHHPTPVGCQNLQSKFNQDNSPVSKLLSPFFLSVPLNPPSSSPIPQGLSPSSVSLLGLLSPTKCWITQYLLRSFVRGSTFYTPSSLVHPYLQF